MNTPLVIGLGTTRQQGKDTLATLLHQLKSRFTRYAFADALKKELQPFIREHYGFDILSCSTEEKELVRDILIAHGMCQRKRDPDYWVKKTITEIKTNWWAHKGAVADYLMPIAVVTDCRFSNEVTLMRATFPGFRFINVTRLGAPPPTAEEEKHYREVAAMADIQFTWGNDTPKEQLQRAAELIEILSIL